MDQSEQTSTVESVQNKSEFLAGVAELMQFRQDLEYLPESKRDSQVTMGTLGAFREVLRKIERGIGIQEGDPKSQFNDHLNRWSSILDTYLTTGTMVQRSAAIDPELWAQHFAPRQTSQPTPFGFAAGVPRE